MEENQEFMTESEAISGIASMLGVGDVYCDKCGKLIRHKDRYCCNNKECYICHAAFDSSLEFTGHFNQQHPREPSRGTRYCIDCSTEAGYLRMVISKKTREAFPALFVFRDEETTDDGLLSE